VKLPSVSQLRIRYLITSPGSPAPSLSGLPRWNLLPSPSKTPPSAGDELTWTARHGQETGNHWHVGFHLLPGTLPPCPFPCRQPEHLPFWTFKDHDTSQAWLADQSQSYWSRPGPPPGASLCCLHSLECLAFQNFGDHWRIPHRPDQLFFLLSNYHIPSTDRTIYPQTCLFLFYFGVLCCGRYPISYYNMLLFGRTKYLAFVSIKSWWLDPLWYDFLYFYPQGLSLKTVKFRVSKQAVVSLTYLFPNNSLLINNVQVEGHHILQ